MLSLDAELDATADLLWQTKTAAYIGLCSLTLVTWDWILSLREDCRIVKRCGPSIAIVAYFLARFSAVAFCVLVTMFYTGVPQGDHSCSSFFTAIGVSTVIGSGSKAYLFYLRIRAVYNNSRFVTLCVGLGWLAVVSSRASVGLMVNVSRFNLGHTWYCFVNSVQSLPVISLWLNFAYDTGIFIAISARLTSHSTPTTSYGILSLIRGHSLPYTMRYLLQDGQLYYLTTVVFLLIPALIFGAPINPIFQGISTVPAISMETIMTCKVFRAMILRSELRDVSEALSGGPVGAHASGRTVIFQDDTLLELRIRTMNVAQEQMWGPMD